MAKSNPATYIHSRVMTEVIDRSIVTPEITVPVDFVLFAPFFSDKGKDSVLLPWDNETIFVEKNGEPNERKHGQAIYNAINFMRGGGRVLGLRLMPSDAKYAYGVLNIRTRLVEDYEFLDPEDPDTVLYTADIMEISPTMSPLPSGITIPEGLVEEQKLKLIAKTLQGSTYKDAGDGWVNNYLTVFKCKGRGKYGNDMGIKLSLNVTLDEDIEDARRYYLEMGEKNKTGLWVNKSDVWNISFLSTSTDLTGTVSEYMDTVIASDTFKDIYNEISAYTSEDCYEALIASFTPLCTALDPADPDEYVEEAKNIDFLFLVDKEGNKYKKFVEPLDPADIPSNGADTDFSFTGGYLQGGSDGGLDSANYDPLVTTDIPAAIADVKEELLVQAFRGEIAPDILSLYKYQINVILDANFPIDVKKEMVYLARTRLDVVPYLDCGFAATVESAINFRKQNFADITDYLGNFWGQSGQAYDSYTKKYLDFTYIYDIAYKLPFNRRYIGPNKLMAGVAKGEVMTMKNLSWIPSEDQKTDLLRATINYVEEIRLDQYAIMSNRTTYPYRLSYLSSIRNVQAITEAIWIARQILTDLRFEEDANATMVKAKEAILRNCQYLQLNGPVERMDCKVMQTLQDKYENSARAYLEMKFKDYIETWRFYVVAVR